MDRNNDAGCITCHGSENAYEIMTPEKLLKMAAKRQKDAEKQRIAEEITREINRSTCGESGDKKSQKAGAIGKFEDPLKINDVRRKANIRRIIAAAAMVVFVIAIFGGVMSFFTAPVDADKSNQKYVEEQGDQVVVREGLGSKDKSVEAMNVVITEWKDVQAQKDYLSQLLVPEYIPDGFEFVQLSIEKDGDNYRVEYIYEADDDKMLSIIQQSYLQNKNQTAVIEEYDKEMEVDGYLVHISNYPETKYMVMVRNMKEEKDTVGGNISEKEGIKILTELQ